MRQQLCFRRKKQNASTPQQVRGRLSSARGETKSALLLILFGTFLLQGCASRLSASALKENPPARRQAVALQQAGADVLVAGDHIRIVLLSRDVFQGNASTPSSRGQALLSAVSRFADQFVTGSVVVAVHAAPGLPAGPAAKLSQAQANSIVRWLWQSGLDTRVLYARGSGNAFPVAQPCGPRWRDNSRIDILFDKRPEGYA